MGLFDRLIRSEPRDCRDECGTWRVGELAVSINRHDEWHLRGRPSRGPDEGVVQRVTAVSDAVEAGYLITTLSFAEWPDTRFCAAGFRKIVADDRPAEAEFTSLIRRPSRAPADRPREPVTSSGSAPECAPLPDPDAPAVRPAGVSALSRPVETPAPSQAGARGSTRPETAHAA